MAPAPAQVIVMLVALPVAGLHLASVWAGRALPEADRTSALT